MNVSVLTSVNQIFMNPVERFTDTRRHNKESRLIPEPNRESSVWWKWPRIRWNLHASSQFILTAIFVVFFVKDFFHDELNRINFVIKRTEMSINV